MNYFSDGVKCVGVYQFVYDFIYIFTVQMPCSSTTVIVRDGGCLGLKPVAMVLLYYMLYILLCW